MTSWTQLPLAIGTRLHPSKARALRNRIEPGWQAQAACADDPDSDAWFPPRETPRWELADQLAVCQGCSVRRSCLAAGLLGREVGIWSGTTEVERDGALTALNLGSRADPVLDDLLDPGRATAARGVA